MKNWSSSFCHTYFLLNIMAQPVSEKPFFWQMSPPPPHIRAGSSWRPVTDLSDLVVPLKIWTAASTPEFPAWVGSSLYTGISGCTHGNEGVANVTHLTGKKWRQSGLIYCYVWPSPWLMNGLGTSIDHGKHHHKCAASVPGINMYMFTIWQRGATN